MSEKNARRLLGRVGGLGLNERFGHVVCGLALWCVNPVACLKVEHLGFRVRG